MVGPFGRATRHFLLKFKMSILCLNSFPSQHLLRRNAQGDVNPFATALAVRAANLKQSKAHMMQGQAAIKTDQPRLSLCTVRR